MAVRKPKIISREVARRAGMERPFTSLLPAYTPPGEKTEADRLFDLIYRKSVEGYCFTDDLYGIPWIERNDIEEKGGGIFVIRFRCPPSKVHDVYFGRMSKAVCQALNCSIHFIHNTKYEYGLPFEDCIWVLQKDELSLTVVSDKDNETDSDNFGSEEEITGELVDDSTVEEIDERFNKALEDFV